MVGIPVPGFSLSVLSASHGHVVVRTAACAGDIYMV